MLAQLLSAFVIVAGVVVAWLWVDRLLLRRDERLHRGHAAWSETVRSRTFHSTGWEETVPPLDTSELAGERLPPRTTDRAAV